MSAPRSPSRRRLAVLGGGLAALVAVAALAGCSKKEPDVACPDVRIDSDTAKLTKFRDGPGRDLTDVAYEVEILGFSGDCGGKAGQAVEVKMKVLFQVTRGPAMGGPVGEFAYFTAIPAFYPSPEAKQILPVAFTFPREGNINSMMVRDEEVRISIPLTGGVSPSQTPIYIGLQLNAEDLDFNRRGRR